MRSASTEWLTLAEASAYLKVTRATLYRWARTGRVRLHRFGARTTRVKRSELDGLLPAKEPLTGWAMLSHDSFARDWDNDKDAIYDNWRERYGV